MSTPDPERYHNRMRSTDGSNSVRWRLWAAMLALVLVPTMAGIYLTTSLLAQPDAAQGSERARETSESAAGLIAREQAIEGRLLVAAADPAMASLANGINGASDRRLASRVLKGLRGADGSVLRGACIVRSSDGRHISLATRRGSDHTGACAGATPQSHVLGRTTDTITRSRAGEGGAEMLLLATPLRSVDGRNSGVLSVEVDVAALFDHTRAPGDEAVSSMLVDMGSSEVIAVAAAMTDAADGVATVDLGAIVPHVSGIVADDEAAGRELATMGFAPTLAPLWSNGDGTHMGLVQLWPEVPTPMPFDMRLTLLIVLVGAILTIIVLVRYLLHSLEEVADSQAELQVLYHEAREDALADGLTGLGNHRAFQEGLTRQITAYEEGGTPFGLLLLDLDDLKVVNDQDGHAAGDEMLRSMSQTMRELARCDDHLYRTGGDEFAILLPNSDIDDTTTLAERILHFCKRPAAGGRPSPFSGGISGVPAFTRQRDMVYRQADAALYWAKRHGRGSVEIFDSERDHLPDEFSDVTGNAVAEVVTGKLLRPVFQPIVDLRSGRVLGFEGLIRPDPNGPLPDTERLFAAAAASGRTVELDLACIEAVVKGARAIGPDRLLTINLSPRTLEVEEFDAAWLLRGLVRNGISPSRVIIELTEREEIEDLPRLRQTFAMLQQHGLRLAADDVGAGNSGLRLLSQVQFDIVKIDLSLVQDGVRQLGSRAVLRSLRDLALSQDARIVAEGVETAEQLQVIRELDIGAGQGFLLGRPNTSVDKTFVDLRRLESGLVIPADDAPEAPPTGVPSADESEGLSPERWAMFLSPRSTRRTFGAEPGAA